ncbi:hypothetical protein [Synechococcus sp. PCC 7336]|uniref:aldose epimerase family protein n=1 Tax=Synechococcus sp. PCC 7336 TaxID=195250 RepID=UPI000348CACE|nr:hypothetical protein [Synechococcus sp. PCC 7336]
MFDIHCETDRYKTYILHDRTTDFRVSVVPERGGAVVDIQKGDRSLLYLDRERFADPALSMRGGIPILFPICGNLPENRYTWQGQVYELPQHGFVRNLPWTVTQMETEAAAVLTVTLTDTPATRSVYPFAFELNFTYRLTGSQLAIEQQFRNRSQNIMPFSIGFHPYFAVADKTQLQFELPTKVYFDRANNIADKLTAGWNFDLDEIDAALDPAPSDAALEATVRDRDLQLKLTGSPHFRHLVFWTVKGKPFYCLEPWSAPRNAINTGIDLILLEPGAHLNADVTLAFLLPPAERSA